MYNINNKKCKLCNISGSSMTTVPFCNLPSLSKYVICNLQSTPYDEEAELVIHDQVDTFMLKLLNFVGKSF